MTLRSHVAVPAIVVAALVAAALPAISSGASQRTVRRCGVFHYRFPGGKPEAYGMYIEHGHVSCRDAIRIVKAIFDGKGTHHGQGSSYSTYKGWYCPDGHMGYQGCQSSKLTSTATPARSFLSQECLPVNDPGCPRRINAP